MNAGCRLEEYNQASADSSVLPIWKLILQQLLDICIFVMNSRLQSLAEIDHPVARIVVEYRQIEKLLQNLDCYCSEKEVRRLPGPNDPVSKHFDSAPQGDKDAM